MKSRRLHFRRRSSFWTVGLIILLILGGNFTACETEDWILEVDCNDCFSFRPDTAKLIVYLTINQENDSVPLTFYKGDSNGEIDWQDTATTSEFYLDAEVGINYTVRAEYRSGSKTVVAFDSDEMTLKESGNQCGYPCYIIRGGIFEIRLME
jgi:hypothetical protein